MGLIEKFIARYRREFDYYDQTARLIAQALDSNLQAAGIRSMVTSRAKSPASLETKVRQRARTKNYTTLEEISADMHAWSEVEHDLIYKPFEGTLSDEEYAILDELNGLVIAGEIALERLQKAGETRVAGSEREFVNHFDLASHLLSRTALEAHGPLPDSALGRVDLLFELLKRLNLLTPELLKPYLDAVHHDTERRPIAEQIIDRLLRRKNRGTRFMRRSEQHDHSRFTPRKQSSHQLRNSTEPSVTSSPNGPGWSASCGTCIPVPTNAVAWCQPRK
jgi:hypothetical protein